MLARLTSRTSRKLKSGAVAPGRPHARGVQLAEPPDIARLADRGHAVGHRVCIAPTEARVPRFRTGMEQVLAAGVRTVPAAGRSFQSRLSHTSIARFDETGEISVGRAGGTNQDRTGRIPRDLLPAATACRCPIPTYVTCACSDVSGQSTAFAPCHSSHRGRRRASAKECDLTQALSPAPRVMFQAAARHRVSVRKADKVTIRVIAVVRLVKQMGCSRI
jgi:hypothetical protein